MAESTARISVTSTWTNLNTLSGIAAGSRMLVQNTSSNAMELAISENSPVSVGPLLLAPLGEFGCSYIVNASESAVWARGDYPGQLHCRELPAVSVDPVPDPVTVQITAPAEVNNDSPYVVNMLFSQSVNGFVIGDIQVTNATLSGFVSNTGADYDVTVTPDGSELDVVFTVPAGVASGPESNNSESSETTTYTLATGVTKIAIAKDIGGTFSAGLLDIDADTWFNLTDYLDTNDAPGTDVQIAVDSNLSHYVLEAERDIYSGWQGLVVGTLDASGTPSAPVGLPVDGSYGVRPYLGSIAINRDGAHVAVTMDNDGVPNLYLKAQTSPGVWGSSYSLTSDLGAGPLRAHASPAFNFSGTKVCWVHYTNYYDYTEGMEVWEANVDGTGRTMLFDNTIHASGNIFKAPSYDSHDDIVFEAEWGSGEQSWRWVRTDDDVELISPTYSNDNTCGGIPGGRIASYWIGRAGAPSGAHEIKVMSNDGTGPVILQQGTNWHDRKISGGQR